MDRTPEVKAEERISTDDISRDEGKTAVVQKGGTLVDEREMTRMGKKQELRVCRVPFRSCDLR